MKDDLLQKTDRELSVNSEVTGDLGANYHLDQLFLELEYLEVDGLEVRNTVFPFQGTCPQ